MTPDIHPRLAALGPRFCRVKAADKVPIGKGWQENPLDPCDPALSEHLAAGGNYGVIGGGGVVIVDIDDHLLALSLSEMLPYTFTVESPGSHGFHFYYRTNGDLAPIRLNDNGGSNIGDVQGKGKMVVGPGCTHPKGGTYTVVRDMDLAVVTRETLTEALAEFISIPHRPGPDTPTDWSGPDPFENVSIRDVIPLHDFRWSGPNALGPHPGHGSTGGVNLSVDTSRNQWHCFRHNSGGGVALWLAVEAGILDCSQALPGALRGDDFHRVLGLARDRGLAVTVPRRRRAAESEREPADVAADIARDHHFIYIREYDRLFVYQDGCYIPAYDFALVEAQRRFGGDASRHKCNEVVGFIERSNSVSIDGIDNDPDWICVGNGWLNLRTGDLEPHSPRRPTIVKIPARYEDPGDEAMGLLDMFLDTIVQPEDRPVLEEMMGFCLWRKYEYHKAFMLIGDGRNGKSTILTLLTAMLGEGNCSGESLQSLANSQFAAANLKGMLANVCDDMPSDKVRDTGAFKMLTGASPIRAELKYVQERLRFRNYAKAIFSTNIVPPAKDNTEAFFRRWMLINFPNKFEGPDEIPDLPERLTTPEGLNAALIVAGKGLRRLWEQGGFSRSETTDQIRQRYEDLTNPAIPWDREVIIEESGYDLPEADLFASYSEWMDEHNYPKKTKAVFWRDVWPGLHVNSARVLHGGRGKQKPYRTGVRFREPEEDDFIE